jgi:hypothetical protein
MTRRQEAAADRAQYVLGGGLLWAVAGLTSAVMALGFGIVTAVDYVLHRGS